MSKTIIDFDKPFTENYKAILELGPEVREKIINRCGITQNQFKNYFTRTKIPASVNQVANDVMHSKLLELQKND